MNEEEKRRILSDTRPEWCIILVAAAISAGTESLIDQIAAVADGAINRAIMVTDSNVSASFYRRRLGKISAIVMPGNVAHEGDTRTFSWARAANVGAAACRGAKRFLFVKEDVLFRGDLVDVLASFAAAVDAADTGMAVPLIEGHSFNPAQSCFTRSAEWSHLPFFDMTEFADDALIAMSSGAYHSVGGFDEWLDGEDWAQIDVQKKLADRGLGAVVVPSVVVSCASRISDRAEYNRNLLRFCHRHGIHCDRDTRPSLPRLSVRGNGQRHKKSLCVIVNGAGDLPKLISAHEASENCDEIAVVDVGADSKVRDYVMSIKGSTRGRYAVGWSWYPRNHVLNLADGVEATFNDATEPDYGGLSISGPRLRVGSRYTLPHFEEQIHIGMLEGCGLGDTLMMSAAIHALVEQFPHLAVTVHHGWEAGRVLEHNPDIAEVKILGPGDILPRETTQFVGVGIEGTLRRHFADLSIETAAADPDLRRVRYYIQDSEHDAAVALLAASGHLDGYLVGVQLSGAWQVKSWAHTRACIDRLLADGAVVVVFAGGKQDLSELPTHDHLFVCNGQPIRTAIAVLGVCDAFVGFDSGLAFAAGAIGTPSVTLWGPNDPNGFLLDTDPENAVTIRKRTPAQCKVEFGTDCRSAAAGSRCPLRDPAARGGQCLDEITVDDVAEALAAFPRWGVPVTDRRKHR